MTVRGTLTITFRVLEPIEPQEGLNLNIEHKTVRKAREGEEVHCWVERPMDKDDNLVIVLGEVG